MEAYNVYYQVQAGTDNVLVGACEVMYDDNTQQWRSTVALMDTHSGNKDYYVTKVSVETYDNIPEIQLDELENRLIELWLEVPCQESK